MKTKNQFQKQILSILLALVMIIGIVPVTALADTTLPFSDVSDNAWYRDAVEFAYGQGLMKGVSETRFAPNGLTTRAMLVTVLYRIEGSPAVYGQQFSDVEVGSWYDSAVIWARNNNIVNGYSDTVFGPNDNITREQLAAIAYRYVAFKGYDVSQRTDLSAFNDGANVSSWAADAMSWAVAVGLIKGVGGSLLSFQSDATRAEIAAILMRLDQEVLPNLPQSKPVTVVFDSNGGSEVVSQTVHQGSYISDSVSPVRSGYEFIGWFENKNETDWTNVFDFDNTPIIKDITVYALWVDVTTDNDTDGLSDDLEKYIGTDINERDTDKDGLTDYQEVMLFNYDPLKIDSDGNGVQDYLEDYDSDGLNNIDEINNGLNPILIDTDNDALNDYEEISIYNTLPIKSDSDGDGANDGTEISKGTNPLIANESFIETVSFGEISDEQLIAVSVETEVKGEQVGTLEVVPVSTIDKPDLSPGIPGYIDNAVDITIEGEITEAKLVFEYDKNLGAPNDSFQPRIYYYNEEDRTLEELPNQTVENGKVSAVIEHFSSYILLNKIEFDLVWEDEIRPPSTSTSENTYMDMLLLIDCSGSMGPQGANNDPENIRLDVSKKLVEKMGENDRVGVISFGQYITLKTDFTTDKSIINNAIDSVGNTDNYTYINKALNKGFSVFDSSAREDSIRYMILLTDGKSSDDVYNYEANAKNRNIVIFTVGLGTNLDENLLKSIATSTGGKYYHATKADDLYEVYERIEEDTVDYVTDSNEDGISDYYTELIKNGTLKLSNGFGEFEGIDFNYDENGNSSADYDGDGVLNGDELIIKESGNKVYLIKKSDPMLTNSDTDEFDDHFEYVYNTDPLIPSYNARYIDYTLNDDNFTYVGVLAEEDEWWNEAARQTWSSITFNWSHEDEAKRLIASFFDEYSNIETIKKNTSNIEKENAAIMAEFGIADAYEAYKDGKITKDAYKEIVKYFKTWLGAGRSAKNLSSDHFVQLKAQIGLFNYRYKWGKFDFKKVDMKGEVVSFVINETYDIYEWNKTYSAVLATDHAFIECKDVLATIIANDDIKEKYISKAASDILLVVNGEYDKFNKEMYKDLATATGENLVEMGVSILSAANPFTCAINLAIGVLDLITPATTIAEATYSLYVVDEIANASKTLFRYSSKTNMFYDIENEDRRHIEILIYARMYGGEFAKTITGKQHYWGLFNDAKIRKEYADAINSENENLLECLEALI